MYTVIRRQNREATVNVNGSSIVQFLSQVSTRKEYPQVGPKSKPPLSNFQIIGLNSIIKAYQRG